MDHVGAAEPRSAYTRGPRGLPSSEALPPAPSCPALCCSELEQTGSPEDAHLQMVETASRGWEELWPWVSFPAHL